MVTGRELLKNARERLEQAGLENTAMEAAELFALATGTDCRSGPAYGNALDAEADGALIADVDELTERRLSGEPLQYILGEWEFYGLPIKVGKGVLIPRPETELLISLSKARMGTRKGLTVIDLCSGSGCIGIAAAKQLDCERVFCVEHSDDALVYLEQNLKINKVHNAEAIKGDVTMTQTADSLPDADLIICNPPYLTAQDMKELQREVTFEPEQALFGGEDGLDLYRDITRIWSKKLKAGGMLMFELGIDQEQSVAQMMIQHGLKNVRWKKDAFGKVRCIFGIGI